MNLQKSKDAESSGHTTPDPWILNLLRTRLAQDDTSWHISPSINQNQPWITASPGDQKLPSQGWKIHVSSYRSNAKHTIKSILPVIIAQRTAFKVLGSMHWLQQINRGSAGISQVGKFATIYILTPEDGPILASLLANATQHLRGPEITSDWPVRPNSIIYYRYGSFRSTLMQTIDGQILPSIVNADGKIKPDIRTSAPSDSHGFPDPFKANRLCCEPRSSRIVAGRYCPVQTLSHKPGIIVQLGLDTKMARRCILKRVYRSSSSENLILLHKTKDDPYSRIMNEGDLLFRLNKSGATPLLYEIIEDSDELVLVTEDLGGETLERYVGRKLASGSPPSSNEVCRLAIMLCELVEAIHAIGYIHGDLKSSNLIICDDRRLRLIDLDLSSRIGASRRSPGVGTRGYMSKGCLLGSPASEVDDLYSIGALLFYLLTGAEPSRAPDPENLLSRELLLKYANAKPEVRYAMEQCLSADRSTSVFSLKDLKTRLQSSASPDLVRYREEPSSCFDTVVSTQELYKQAKRAADLICYQAEQCEGGVMWRSSYYAGKGMIRRDLASGMSGTLLALADLADEYNCPEYIETLRKGSNVLACLEPLPGDRPQGLYVGEAGIVTSLLRAGQVMNDIELISQAKIRLCSTGLIASPNPDIFHGDAGRLLSCLLFWDETKDQMLYDNAILLGDHIISLQKGNSREAYWAIPEEYSGLGGNIYLGYAHGAAGIADVLLDLYEVTNEERFLDVASSALTWIKRHAMPFLPGDAGLGWPMTSGGRVHPPFWCHGATGIGRLFLHAARLGLLCDSEDLLHRIARSVLNGASWASTSLCHGLSGNIEYLLDLASHSGNACYLSDADRLFSIMNAFLVESDHGCGWQVGSPTKLNPDYMEGYAGIALVCMRRAIVARPSQLSRAGFSYRAS